MGRFSASAWEGLGNNSGVSGKTTLFQTRPSAAMMLAQPANREHLLTRRDVIAYSRFISGLARKASFTASFCCVEENPGAGDIRSESTRLRESRVLTGCCPIRAILGVNMKVVLFVYGRLRPTKE